MEVRRPRLVKDRSAWGGSLLTSKRNNGIIQTNILLVFTTVSPTWHPACMVFDLKVSLLPYIRIKNKVFLLALIYKYWGSHKCPCSYMQSRRIWMSLLSPSGRWAEVPWVININKVTVSAVCECIHILLWRVFIFDCCLPLRYRSERWPHLITAILFLRPRWRNSSRNRKRTKRRRFT